MGQCFSEGCGSFLLPKKAPEWYTQAIAGDSNNVHVQPAPPGSLLLLEFVGVEIPSTFVGLSGNSVSSAELTKSYYMDGLECSGNKVGTDELLFSLGPTHLRCTIKPDLQKAQLWPGDIGLWVEDIRQAYDKINMLGKILGTDLVREFTRADRGEFALIMTCPFRTNTLTIQEAPTGWAKKIQAVGSSAGSSHKAKSNAVVVSDVTYRMPLASGRSVAAMAAFFRHYLFAAVTEDKHKGDVCTVHFSPADCLHQTLVFEEDSYAVSFSRPVHIGVYVVDLKQFHLVYVRAHKDGIVENDRGYETAQTEGELRLRSVDPTTKTEVTKLTIVVRHPRHPECPVPGRVSSTKCLPIPE